MHNASQNRPWLPGTVTEITFVDENSERELLSLLGDWYEPESLDSVFFSIASDAVFGRWFRQTGMVGMVEVMVKEYLVSNQNMTSLNTLGITLNG